MGTPLDINVPSVRVNRATAIFLIKMPMHRQLQNDGVHDELPCGVPYHIFKPTIACR